MKKYFVLLMVNLFLVPSAIHASDSVNGYSIKEALATEQAKTKLGEDIKFYFGDQSHKKILKKYGVFRTNKRTNASNKPDLEACQWVFLSALKSLKARAVKVGGNAIINIKSNYKNNLTSSQDEFQCGVGVLAAGVALVGTVVKIKH